MCDSNVMSVIHSVASDKIGSGNMFTAFDISLEVQAELKRRNIFDYNLHRHRHLKSDVHGVLETYILNNTYNRVLQNVGAPDDAYVYHPAGSDPQMYVPMTRRDSPATPAIPVNAAIAMGVGTIPQPLVVNDDGRKPDERGSVTVSATALRDAGMESTDTAYVFQDNYQGNPALFVSKNLPQGISPITTYTVNGSGNVRITKFVFEYVNLIAQSYDFVVNGDQVIVIAK